MNPWYWSSSSIWSFYIGSKKHKQVWKLLGRVWNLCDNYFESSSKWMWISTYLQLLYFGEESTIKSLSVQEPRSDNLALKGICCNNNINNIICNNNVNTCSWAHTNTVFINILGQIILLINKYLLNSYIPSSVSELGIQPTEVSVSYSLPLRSSLWGRCANVSVLSWSEAECVTAEGRTRLDGRPCAH